MEKRSISVKLQKCLLLSLFFYPLLLLNQALLDFVEKIGDSEMEKLVRYRSTQRTMPAAIHYAMANNRPETVNLLVREKSRLFWVKKKKCFLQAWPELPSFFSRIASFSSNFFLKIPGQSWSECLNYQTSSAGVEREPEPTVYGQASSKCSSKWGFLGCLLFALFLSSLLHVYRPTHKQRQHIHCLAFTQDLGDTCSLRNFSRIVYCNFTNFWCVKISGNERSRSIR